MTVDRVTVYAAIAGEIDYQEDYWRHQCATRDLQYEPSFNRTTEQYLISLIRDNHRLMYLTPHSLGAQRALSVFRQLAATCVSCMEANGGIPRNINTGTPGEFMEPFLSRRKVRAIIDTERTYQDELSRGDNVGVYGYAIIFQHYLSEATKQWTINPGDEYCLDAVRKLAAIAVRAMEDHGVILREPFNV